MRIIHFAIFNLILYSIIGWIIEGVYNYIITGSFEKEGFLKGPYKPMYGIAFTILVMLDKYYNLNLISKLMLSLIVPTSIEFISGYILSSFFNEKYWDYSSSRLNYKGIITVKFSFYWMILCYFGINFVQPFVNNIYISLEKYFKIFNSVISLIIIIDIIITISIKLKLKNSRLLNS
ncbi:putative ABC transporter permease [Clostridium sp. Sa3CUN1]|uniref:ABC transporter permease n=1 Tax=Clostridium gallinarum TaxID=2762246 RepID=A0ABR8Q7W2_9CLOT|nr:putative ABC transporter permease [Clostridium gallinarum]MBD7916519.1 putative ABC transporter permease [Clostridium gallinarum]